MARTENATCSVCHNDFVEVIPDAGRRFDAQYMGLPVCGNCRSADREKKRREHFDQLDSMTVEDRIRRIEEWIYNYTNTDYS